MHAPIRGGLVLAVTMTGLAVTSEAGAVPVVLGCCEKVVHLRELPSQLKEELRRQWGQDVAIGYKYAYLHVLWCNLWTGKGRHVLLAGDKYRELEPNQWIALLGEEEYRSLGKPFLYRFPLFWVIFVGLGLLAIGAILFNAVQTRSSGSKSRRQPCPGHDATF